MSTALTSLAARASCPPIVCTPASGIQTTRSAGVPVGARVTLTHFGATFDKKIKPWILPDLNNRIAEGAIHARWNTRVTGIRGDAVEVDV